MVADVLHTFYTGAIIPEFPAWTILPLFMIATLFVIIIKKENLKMSLQ